MDEQDAEFALRELRRITNEHFLDEIGNLGDERVG